jgi:hypothetical protein
MDEYERQEILRRSAELMEQVDRVNEARAAREERGEEPWQQLPQPEPPSAPVRPPERRARGPSPPMPDRVQRTVHDAAGRVASIETYEGAGAQAIGRWEAWVRTLVDQKISGFAEPIGRALAMERKEIEASWRAENQRLATQLQAALDQMRKMSDTLARLERQPFGRLDDDIDVDRLLPH